MRTEKRQIKIKVTVKGPTLTEKVPTYTYNKNSGIKNNRRKQGKR